MSAEKPNVERLRLKDLHDAVKTFLAFLPDGEYAGLGNLRFRMRETGDFLTKEFTPLSLSSESPLSGLREQIEALPKYLAGDGKVRNSSDWWLEREAVLAELEKEGK